MSYSCRESNPNSITTQEVKASGSKLFKYPLKIHYGLHNVQWEKTSVALVRERMTPTFVDRGCHVVSVADPYGRILDFLGRNVFFYFLQIYNLLYKLSNKQML
jgi:hypothetical protein